MFGTERFIASCAFLFCSLCPSVSFSVHGARKISCYLLDSEAMHLEFWESDCLRFFCLFFFAVSICFLFLSFLSLPISVTFILYSFISLSIYLVLSNFLSPFSYNLPFHFLYFSDSFSFEVSFFPIIQNKCATSYIMDEQTIYLNDRISNFNCFSGPKSGHISTRKQISSKKILNKYNM